MDAARANVETVERLRAHIQTLQAAPRTHLAVLRTGVAAVDALLPGGGFPLGQVVELWGSAASGRTRLALRAVAEAHRALRLAAYVDGAGELYPPALSALGVNPARLLWVCPPGGPSSAERRPSSQLGWAALQLLRSGAFVCVVLDLTHTGHRLPPQTTKRLLDAASHAGGLLLLLTPEETPGDGSLRLRMTAGSRGVHVEVVRSRQGMTARSADVPWETLGPGSLPLGHEGLAPVPLPALSTKTDKPFQRPRTSEVRNGLCGIQGQRPGRDMALPALGPGLGLS
jgi:recombination protein RecA